MSDVLIRLYEVVEERKSADPETSYIAKKLAQGTEKIAQKVGEEAVEAVIAAVAKKRDEVISESADLLFHWLLMLSDAGVRVEEVYAELERREGNSGLDEKARRKMR